MEVSRVKLVINDYPLEYSATLDKLELYINGKEVYMHKIEER